MAGVSKTSRGTTVPVERSVSTSQLKGLLSTFERALRRATTDAGVNIYTLERELRAGRPSRDATAVFKRLVDTVQSRFAKQVQISAGCGGGTVTSREPTNQLTPRQVTAVLGAVIEARAKGVGKLDSNKNSKVTTGEAKKNVGSDLASQLAELAARVSTELKKAPAKPRPVARPSPPSVSVGC